jgi:CDP-diacylglycerol--glycerol-3-phosphate 3-phosphatidyltransferase
MLQPGWHYSGLVPDKSPAWRNQQPGAWNVANALTAARLVLVPVFGWLLLRDDGADTASRFAAAAVFALAMFTDKLDGDLARKRGLVTDVGKIADPIADKALTGMALIGLSILEEIPWWVTIVVLVREWGITALRFAVIRYGVMAASRGGKLKTTLQGIALGLYILPLPDVLQPVAVTFLVLAVVVTVVTGLDYVMKAWQLYRNARRA